MTVFPDQPDCLLGSQVAMALGGSWRCQPPPLSAAEVDLAGIAVPLLEAGQGGLVWWRLRNAAGMSDLQRRFRAIYRSYTADALAQEEQIERVFNLLRVFGVEPLLIKGWASARLFAESGLRPYGDIDLCVAPHQLPQVQEILGRYSCFKALDLHAGVPDLLGRGWDQLWQRSQLVPLGSASIRILSPEDHLRLIALHLIRHGAWRPLWLCDVAAAVEARPANFDWDYCLKGDERLSGWVLTVIGLASRLLGAQFDHPPLEARAADVPTWLINTVLWRWGAGRTRRSILHYLRHPREGLQGLFYNGLNPIKATFRLGVRPRSHAGLLAVQLAAWAARIVELPDRICTLLARWQTVPARSYVTHRQGPF